MVWNKWCLFLCHFYFHFLPRPDNFTTLDTLTFPQPRLSQYFSSDIIICIPNLLPQPASPIVDLPPPRPQPSRLPSANSRPGLTLHQHYTIIMIIIAKITFLSLMSTRSPPRSSSASLHHIKQCLHLRIVQHLGSFTWRIIDWPTYPGLSNFQTFW